MKIERIETVRHQDLPNLTYVLVHTADGLVGTGETFYGAEAVEAHVHAVAAPLLIGQDARRVAAHNVTLENYVGYTGSGAEARARSAIDMALWDLRAQAAQVPLYDTLGGATRESIPVYNTCAGSTYVRSAGQSSRNWGLDAPPAQYEDLQRFLHDAGGLAQELLAEGITGMKIWPFDLHAEDSRGTAIGPAELRTALRPFEQIRDAVGDQMRIMVELHALWTVPAARTIVKALAPFEPFWIEDPVRSDLPGGLEALRGVIEDAGTMLAAGETTAQLASFVPLVGPGPIDVVTLDLGWCGGITQANAIAALAAATGKVVAPHDCTGPIALTAATHFSVSAPNALLQETVRAALRGWYQDVVTELPVVRDGAITPPAGPGLGVRLQPDFVRSAGAVVRAS